MIECLSDHSQMSCFSHYHVHSHSLCHNYSYFLALLTSLSAHLSDFMLRSMPNLMLNSTLNLMLNLTSDPSRKPCTLNLTMLNHCALMSTADLVHLQSYISMSDHLLAHASVSLPNLSLLN